MSAPRSVDYVRVIDGNGVTRQWWDDATRTYHEYDAAAVETFSRPYSVQENADADARALAATQDANRRSIEDKLDAAMADIQALLDTSAGTINAGPAPFIKTLARVARLLIRLARRRFDGNA